MTLQKQVMECQEMEQRQRELQRNINFYKEQQEQLQSKKENQIKKILEQIKPEVKLNILFHFSELINKTKSFMLRIFNPIGAMLWTRCVRRQDKFPKLLALDEIAMIMVSSIPFLWDYIDDKCIRPSTIFRNFLWYVGIGNRATFPDLV